MIDVLDSLTRIPGVRSVVLATEDGVPVAVCDRETTGSRGQDRGKPQRSNAALSMAQGAHESEGENVDSLAGLAITWMREVARAVGLMSWDPPARMVMRATRGTLILRRARHGIILVVLDRGARPEDLRLPMEGVVGRMQRILKTMGNRQKNQAPDDRKQTTGPSLNVAEPPGAVPEPPSGPNTLSLHENPTNRPETPGS